MPTLKGVFKKDTFHLQGSFIRFTVVADDSTEYDMVTLQNISSRYEGQYVNVSYREGMKEGIYNALDIALEHPPSGNEESDIPSINYRDRCMYLIDTIWANVDNGKLDDAGFREFLRNSLPPRRKEAAE